MKTKAKQESKPKFRLIKKQWYLVVDRVASVDQILNDYELAKQHKTGMVLRDTFNSYLKYFLQD